MDAVKRLKPCLFFLLIVVVAALWLPRGLALDRFVTVDEPRWLMRSANFYHALSQGAYRFTFQREHPGVTITWAGTAGFFWRFRNYVEVRPGQFERPGRLHLFLKNRNISSMELLEAGRTFVVLGITLTLGLAFLYAGRLLGAFPAAFAFLLLALDPFSVALSRLLHLDGLMSALALLSILAFASYLYQGRRWIDLLISAGAAGLAWLTKSPAFFLAPFFGLLLLWEWGRGFLRPGEWSLGTLWRRFSPLLIWFVLGSVAFVLFWPAMWVDPWGSLGRVFSLATTYASEGHDSRLFFAGVIYDIGESPWFYYPVAYLWRATPAALAGLALALGALVFPTRLPQSTQRGRLMLVLLAFSLLFGLFLSLSAKKFDRYLLPVFAPLDIVAALGWLALVDRIRGLLAGRNAPIRRLVGGLFLAAPLLVYLAGVIQTYPYYFNYYNPLMGGERKAPQVMLVGWGEGLDQAARYLNQKPGAEDMKVISWSADGCFSYVFRGSAGTIDYDMDIRDMKRADYVVFYINQLQRQAPNPEFLAYFEQLEPEYVVRIGALEYARVYNMQDAP
jgi:hypothetical protein